MGPRADYCCLSKKCSQDGVAPVYELPVGAVTCPMCGSKRIQRIWTPPNINRGVAAHVDRDVAPMWERMHEQKESGLRAEANQRAIEDRVAHEVPLIPYDQRDRLAETNGRIHAVPLRAMAARLGHDAAGKSPVPGLIAGAPIPQSATPAHQVQPIAPTLRQMTHVAHKDTVKP